MNQNVFRGLVAVGSILVLALLAPVIWAAVSGGAGLVALGVVGLVGFGFIKTMPLICQKIENGVLKARKSEAEKNPIEQLQNFLKEKADRVAEFKRAVMSIAAQIMSLEQMLNQRLKENPKYDATERRKSIASMKEANEKLKVKYVNAEQALEELKVAIKDAEFDWKFGQAGQQALRTINATSGEDVMEQMLADTAFCSVKDNFNKVFAELEMEAVTLTQTKQLSYEGGMTLDLTSINLTQKVPA